MTQIKQHTLQSGERILLVSVPTDYETSKVYSNQFNYWTKSNPYNNGDLPTLHYLPTGNWHHIGLSDEITEEEANRLVSGISAGSLGVYHKNYLKDKPYTYSCESALESFKSLMQSLGCEGRYAVLREVK